MKIKQSKEKKIKTPRYCKTHKLHFFKECPLCPQSAQTQLEEGTYAKQIRTSHGRVPGD